MAELTLLLGKSGSGKSASLRNLDPTKTLAVSVDGKKFPFRMKGWDRLTKDTPKGSFYVPSEKGAKAYKQIMGATEEAIKNGKKIVVIDDSQACISKEFFDRAYDHGFDKFTVMGKNFHDLIIWARELPDDVTVYFLHHLELDSDNHFKVKTAGRLLDNQTSIEGKFTTCIMARKNEETYEFTTNVPSESIFKAPFDLFPDDPMDNDLAKVDEAIRAYWSL